MPQKEPSDGFVPTTQTSVHWSCYLAICDDLERLSRYVEFTKANYRTFSVEISRLLLTTCSEVEVAAKAICQKIKADAARTNMDAWRACIGKRFPKMSGLRVQIACHRLTFTPWKDWAEDQNPGWWKGYNAAKHDLDLHYSEANLGNLLEAACGLTILLHYNYYRELVQRQIHADSHFFTIHPFGTDSRWPPSEDPPKATLTAFYLPGATPSSIREALEPTEEEKADYWYLTKRGKQRDT